MYTYIYSYIHIHTHISIYLPTYLSIYVYMYTHRSNVTPKNLKYLLSGSLQKGSSLGYLLALPTWLILYLEVVT